jgi:Ca2+-binding EF-hand superfamily protein
MTDRLIELQELQNQIKKKMKQAFKQIDDKRSGEIKKDNFFKILKALDCDLTLKEKNMICRKYMNRGMISY